MKNRENNKNVFDKIDREMEDFYRKNEKLDREKERLERSIEQYKIELKSIQGKILKLRIKRLRVYIILMFIPPTIFVYLAIISGHKEDNISMGIMSLFLALYSLVFLKRSLNNKLKTGEKR